MRFIAFLIAFMPTVWAFGQQEGTTPDTSGNLIIDTENFQGDLMDKLIIKAINDYRLKQGFDSLYVETILTNAAADQSAFMATANVTTLDQSGKKKTTGKRIRFFGGSESGSEIVVKMPVRKGNELYTYQRVVDDIMFKWLSDKKVLDILNQPGFVFIGTGSSLDGERKKVYSSVVFGDYRSFNAGAARREEMALPFSKKKYGLKTADPKICKRCEKYRNISELQKNLYIKDGKVYFRTEDYKNLKKLLKDPTDGFAIDIVQKVQFPCDGDNIIDYNKVNRGYMLKRVSATKMEKKNMVTNPKEAKKVLEVCLGTLPQGLTEPYELNLMVIIEKKVCRNLVRSFSEEAGVEYVNEIDILADTIIIGPGEYLPTAENATIEFIIPFEQGKSTYNPEDVEPIIRKLKEPDFIIKDLTIEAYSSLEGTDETNKMLQKKRAESILKVLEARQKSKFVGKITTDDNIEDFKRDVQGTEFSNMASMSVSEVQNYIRDNKLHKKMEPILQKHRYARLTMSITYDIGGQKEQAYVVSRFNKSVRENDLPKALLIQKYIFKKVLKGEYDSQAVTGQEIPENASCVGLLMNKLWLEKYLSNEDLSEDLCTRINELYNMAPTNIYLRFNKLYCRVIHDHLTDDKSIVDFQKEISNLYGCGLQEATIDLLNMEYQYKVIEYLDTLDEPHPLLLASLDTVRSIANLKESNWQNSLKLSYIFIKQKDYEFAAKLIEPFIEEENVFEELVFTYLGICSNLPHKLSSNKFVLAMRKARDLNKERYCQLLSKSRMSFQALENTKVKEDYCKVCGGF